MFNLDIASPELIEVLYASKAVTHNLSNKGDEFATINVVHFLSALERMGYGHEIREISSEFDYFLNELSFNANSEKGKCINETYQYDVGLKEILNKACSQKAGELVTIDDVIHILSAKRKDINEFLKSYYEEYCSSKKLFCMSLFKDISIARQNILQEVKGQEHAVERLISNYITYRLTSSEQRKKPISLLFFGDSGIGKTFLASVFFKAVREFDTSLNFKIVDMANYFHNLSAELLFGETMKQGAGELSSFILNNPRSIVVLDEFDRAHEIVHSVLLRALGDGIIQYNGQEVSCQDVIFILTSNIASDLYGNEKTFGIYRDAISIPKQVIKNSLKRSMNVTQHALIDRITEPILFSPLGYNALKSLVVNRIEQCKKTWLSYGFIIEIENIDFFVNMILLNSGTSLSARDIEGIVFHFLNFIIIRWFEENSHAVQNLRKIKIRVNYNEVDLLGENREFSVLCVDDNSSEVEVLKEILQKECRVYHVSTASAAMEYLAKNEKSVDIIFLDLNLSSDDYNTVFESDTMLRSELRASLSLLHDIRKKYHHIRVYVHTNWNLDRHSDLQYNFIKLGGAAGYLQKIKRTDSQECITFKKKITSIMGEIWWERISNKFSKRGKTLNFNIILTRDNDTLNISYAQLHFVTAPLVEDIGWFTVEVPQIRFDDLIGVKTVRMRLQEAIQYLKNPALFSAMDVKPPSGFILHGPPGTGKTSVAKAVANEADVPFINVSISSLYDKFVGETQQNVRKLFRAIRKYAPVIVFIDELDSIGKRSDGSDNYGDSLRDEVINLFLQEMDGFHASDGVVFIGATNYLEKIDEALRRPGRFGRALKLDKPEDPNEIKKLIHKKLVSSQKKLSPNELDILTEEFARWVLDMSPAEIVDAINEACLIAIRERRDTITINDFVESRNLIKYGERKVYWKNEESENERTAIHEAGHALLNYLYGEDILQVTIIERGNASGFAEIPNFLLTSREDALRHIDVRLAGLAAERLLDLHEGDISSLIDISGRMPHASNSPGVSSDLLQATTIAVNMFYRWGMIDGYIAAVSQLTVDDIAVNPWLWKPVASLLVERLNHVNDILNKCRRELHLLKESLVKRKTIFQSDIWEILGDRKILREKVLQS